MAKKPADDEEDDFDLAKMLLKAKQKPVAFALQVASDAKTGAVLRAHHTKPADKMWRDAKKAGGTNKGTQGSLSLKGKVMELICDEEDFPASLKKHLKKMLKEGGHNYKVKLLGPGGNELGEDDDEDDEDEGDISAPGGSATATHGAPEPRARKPEPKPEEGATDPEKAEEAKKEAEELREEFRAMTSKVHQAAERIGSLALELLDRLQRAEWEITEEEIDKPRKALSIITREFEAAARKAPDVDIEELRKTLQKEYDGLKDKIETLVEKGQKGVAGKAKQLSDMFEKQLEGEDLKKADGVLGLLKKFVTTESEKVGAAVGGAAGAAAGAVSGAAGAAAGAVGGAAGKAAGAAGAAAGAVKEGAAGAASGASGAANAAAGAAGGAAQAAAGAVAGAAGAVAGAVSGAAGAVAGVAAGVAGAVGGAGAGSAVAGAAGGAAGAVSGTAKAAGDGVAKAAKAVADRVSSGASKIAGMVGNLGSLIAKGIGALADAAAKAANALAQRIAQGANVAAQGASSAASAAADVVGKVGDAVGEAGKFAGEAIEKVGNAAAGAVKSAHDAAKEAADSAQKKLGEAESAAQKAMAAAQRAAQAAANAADKAAAEAIRQLESAAQAERDRAEAIRGQAEALVEAAKAAAERAKSAQEEAVDKATKVADQLGKAATAVQDKVSDAVAAVSGGAEHLADSLVDAAKKALAEAEAKVGELVPDSGSIGKQVEGVVNRVKDAVQGKLDEAIKIVTGIAKRLADAAKALRDAGQSMIDDANKAADEAQKAKEDSERQQQETLKKVGQKLAEGVKAIGKTIDDKCRQVEEARKSGQSAFDKLCDAAESLAKGIAKAAEGILDRAAEAASKERHSEVQSLVDLLKRAAEEVKGGVQSLKDAADKAIEAAKAEIEKLKTEAGEAIKKYAEWQKEAPTVTGPRAEELLKLAYAARSEAAGTIGGIADRARAFGGEMFDEAVEFITGKRAEAETAIEETIRAIEATKLRLEQQVEAQMARLRERAEARYEEAKTRVTTVMKELEDATSGLDAEHEALLQDVGSDLAAPASKTFLDFQAARKAIEDSAKGIHQQNPAFNEAMKKLAEDGRDAIQRIIGIVKDDAVKVFEGAIDLVAKGIELEVRSLKFQADLVKKGYEAARQAANAEIEKLKKDGTDSLNKMKDYEKRAAGGLDKLWDTIVEDLDAALAELKALAEMVAKLNARLFKPLADLLKAMYEEAKTINDRLRQAKKAEMELHYGTLKEASEKNHKVEAELVAAIARCDTLLKNVRDRADEIERLYGPESGPPIRKSVGLIEAERAKIVAAKDLIGVNPGRRLLLLAMNLSKPEFDIPSIRGVKQTLDKTLITDLLYALDEAKKTGEQAVKAAEAEEAKGEGFQTQARAEFDAFDDYQRTESITIGTYIQTKLEAGQNGDFEAVTELVNRAASLQAHIAAIQAEFTRRGGKVAADMLEQRIKPWAARMKADLDTAAQLYAKGPQKKAA